MRPGATLACAALVLACAAPGTGHEDEPGAPPPAPSALARLPRVPGEAPTPERVALGRLLFFDRVLSGPRDASCADCHRPDRGMADGLRSSRGRSGPLARNAPTLYDAALKDRLFWDRRAPSLETQVFGPLFDPEEMAAEPGELLARLRAIPGYRTRFAAAFPEALRRGEDPIGLANLARALAAFERTLVSRRSRFDRWAAGERGAMSPAELRGFRTFRSLETRCFECHVPPAFTAPLSVSIGVPGDDPGVGGVSGRAAQRGHFGVPTLRNVALTAPYMHDGSLPTLEAVIDFYRRGGGRALGVDGERVDGQIRAFEIDADEVAELVAFLQALSDESARPVIPEAVPSGLPVLRAGEPVLRLRSGRSPVPAGAAALVAESAARRVPPRATIPLEVR